ncbi:MAG: T9SS type A sorting domain-containing protein [Crocinitomicaceae bacterium]|nr:T9SS type A sorting domain-containing protein [Crocinitomicaceae bacterium]
MKQVVLLLALITGLNNWAQAPGNALSFDGTDDHVTSTLPTVFTNITNNDFTIEFWINPNGSTTQRVMHAQQNTSNFVSILLNTSNSVYFYVYEGGNTHSISSDAALPSAWTHVACVWDSGTQGLSMYIDGVLQTGANGGTSSNATDGLFYIGSKTDGSQLLNAELDEFRIWNIARKECEINVSMNSEFDTNQQGLVDYYKFNEGTAGGTNTGVTSLPDFTNNHNGTLVNFALSGTSSNWITSGANITLLNENPANVATVLNESICAGSSYSFGGSNLTSAGVYYDTLTSVVYSCDSIVELNLAITTIDSTVIVSGITLTVQESGATYQWVDCDNGNAPVAGATGQYFTPTANGNYAVEVTVNGCTSTSDCYVVAGVGLEDINPLNGVQVYPNPTYGLITIQTANNDQNLTVIVRSASGEVIHYLQPSNKELITFELEGESGIYFIELISDNERAVHKVIKY